MPGIAQGLGVKFPRWCHSKCGLCSSRITWQHVYFLRILSKTRLCYCYFTREPGSDLLQVTLQAEWGGRFRIWICVCMIPRASLVAQMVTNLPAMQETWVRSLGCKLFFNFHYDFILSLNGHCPQETNKQIYLLMKVSMICMRFSNKLDLSLGFKFKGVIWRIWWEE